MLREKGVVEGGEGGARGVVGFREGGVRESEDCLAFGVGLDWRSRFSWMGRGERGCRSGSFVVRGKGGRGLTLVQELDGLSVCVRLGGIDSEAGEEAFQGEIVFFCRPSVSRCDDRP